MESLILETSDPVVEQARAGDSRARATLADRHYAGVYSLARKLLRDEEAALDVAQETFLRAFAHLDQYDGEHLFSSWLLKIASNHIRDRRRRRRLEEMPDEIPAAASAPEALLRKNEDVDRVRAALSTLPPETREAMILHLQEGLPIREIAFVTDLTENAVRMKIYRGLEKVRALMAEER